MLDPANWPQHVAVAASIVSIVGGIYAFARWLIQRRPAPIPFGKDVLRAWRKEAHRMLAAGDHDAAIMLFTACLAHQPKSADALQGRAQAYEAKGLSQLAHEDRAKAA